MQLIRLHEDLHGVRTARTPVHAILRMLCKYPWLLGGAACALVLDRAIELALGQGLRLALDGHDVASGSSLPLYFVWGLLLTLVIQLATRIGGVRLAGASVEAAVGSLRQSVFAGLLHQAPSGVDENAPSEVQSRITADATVIEEGLLQIVTTVVPFAVVAAGGFALQVWTNWQWALQFAVSSLAVVPFIIFADRIRTLVAKSQDTLAALGGYAHESLSNLRTVQANNQERRHFERFGTLAVARARAVLRIITYHGFADGYGHVVWFANIGLVVWRAIGDVASGTATGGELASFVYYAVLSNSAVYRLMQAYLWIPRTAGAAARLVQLAALKPEGASRSSRDIGRIHESDDSDGALVFEDVSYAYPATPESLALDRVSFLIPVGTRVAIVGPSGAGKSTVLELVLGFCEPRSGRVIYRGRDVTEWALDELRARIAVVPQQPDLFVGTIRDNIAYGKPAASDAEVKSAAEAACAHEFIDALPDGYRTDLGAVASRLSGGQKQRIAIARALLRNPELLLLDEATTGLDSRSEELVQHALKRLMRDRTTMVITHRLETIAAANQVILIDNGKVVAQGTHESLLKESALYARLSESYRDNTADGEEIPAGSLLSSSVA